MNLSDARKIKQQLVRFEGRKDYEGFPFIWKIMICPEGMYATVLKGCMRTLNYDERFSESYSDNDFEIHVIGRKEGEEFTDEPFESFVDRHHLTIEA